MDFPEDVEYSKDHAWLRVEGDSAVVGITDFAQNELGEIVFVDLPRVGQWFKQNEIFGSVEAIKTTSDLYMPASGEVLEFNSRLSKDATLVNTNPFTDGWLIKIKLLNPEEIVSLLSAEGYRKSVNG